jgi:hypothetical protein
MMLFMLKFGFFLCKNQFIIDLTTLIAVEISLDNEKRMQEID